MTVKLKPNTDILEYHISNDKEYLAEVVDRKWGSRWYKIKCDDGLTREFLDIHFIPINEIRDKKLNDLGL